MEKSYCHPFAKGLLVGGSVAFICYAIAAVLGYEWDALGALIGGLTGALAVRLNRLAQ